MKGFLVVVAVIGLVVLGNFVPMVSLGMPGMKEYTFSGMRVLAKPANHADAERLATRIELQAGTVAEALGIEDTSGIGIIVYPSRKDLHRKTLGFVGVFLPDWFIGGNTRDWVLITSPANPGPSHNRESIEQAAVHEYVHVLTDRVNQSLGYWFKEGIALYLAEQVPSPESVRSHREISWEDYANPSALQFAEVGGYTLAYTLIDYIEDRYGWNAVVRLVSDDTDLEQILGVGPRQLFDDWKEWLVQI